MRVFLDANVLFSASNRTSNIAALIARCSAAHVIVSSDFAVEEARRNIELKRPVWRQEFETLLTTLEIVPSAEFEIPVELNDKDRPILCAAIQSHCDLLATGDRRHFSKLYDSQIEGVTVVSLSTLARRITKTSS